MKLLDLFCGAGGAGMGYYRAGFEVTGVDIKPQPHYPFAFIQGDALEYLAEHGKEYDVIHASPPCQAYSITRHSHHKQHIKLIPEVLNLLIATGKPYILENVLGSPLGTPMILCGTMFDLKAIDIDGTVLFLRRHRLFESSQFLYPPITCQCNQWLKMGYKIGGVYGGGSCNRHHAQFIRRGGYTPSSSCQRELMNINWTSISELHQAIPPVYTEWIGKQIMEQLS